MMKKIFFLIGVSAFIVFSFQDSSYAINQPSDQYVTISGSSQFSSSLIAKYMKKHGYVHLRESIEKKHLKTNIFAAKDAEVIVKNKYGTVLGTGVTDNQGDFSITLPRDNMYNVIVRFNGREIKEPVAFANMEDVTLHFGFISSQIIDSWFEKVSRSYCYTCDIRYFETQE